MDEADLGEEVILVYEDIGVGEDDQLAATMIAIAIEETCAYLVNETPRHCHVCNHLHVVHEVAGGVTGVVSCVEDRAHSHPGGPPLGEAPDSYSVVLVDSRWLNNSLMLGDRMKEADNPQV